MKKTLDVKLINPFIQASIEIFKTMAFVELSVGRPGLAELTFTNEVFVVQAGLTGNIKGQVLLVFNKENALLTASNMMGGMPVTELDELSSSALNELCNMIMGNSATIFSTLDILIDITPPIFMKGSKIEFQSDIQALKIPLLNSEGNALTDVYVCISQS